MLGVVAGCDNVAACDVDLCPQSHSAAQNARGGCFHEGGVVAFWKSTVGEAWDNVGAGVVWV